MKTNLLKLAFVALFAMICGNLLAEGTQSLRVTFNGTDNTNWQVSSGGSITSTENGVMNVQMALQDNNKYRADLQYQTSGTYTFNKTKDIVWAIKLTGALPGSSNSRKFEINYKNGGTNTWINGINNPSDQIDCTDGGVIYYFNLGADGFNKLGNVPDGNQTINNIHFILADAVCESAEAKYSVDWVATFASVADLTAKKDMLDDENKSSAIYYNDTKEVVYTTLAEAVSAAVNNDVILVNNDITLDTRVDVDGKKVTIMAGKSGITISRKAGYTGMLFLSTNNNKSDLTLEGLTIDGNNESVNGQLIEASGKVTLKNCVVKNNVTSSTLGVICSKTSNGKLIVDGSAFEDNTVTAENAGVLFCGTSMELKGNVTFSNNKANPNNKANDIYLENKCLLAAKANIEWETPIGLYYKNPAENAAVVGGGVWEKAPVAFVMLNDGWEIYVKEDSQNGDGLLRAITPVTRATAPNSYGTICLPYGATSTGVVLMKMAGRNAAGTGIAFDFVGGSEESATNATLEAGVPYLYRATDGSQVFTYISGSERVTVPTTVKNGFVGTFVDTTIDAGKYFLYTADDKFHPAETAGKIGAYKCYLNTTVISEIAEAGAATSARACVFGVFGNDATGLQIVDTTNSNNGKFMQNGQIVIVKNGKKFNVNGQEVK